MPDVVSPETRSRMMSGIKGTNTRPELLIRSGLHRSGFRFRIHDKSLAGRPDLVFPKYRAVIFVNGCFWHAHHCHLFKWPKTRTEFWQNKITGNLERDSRNIETLMNDEWRVLTVWECALKGKTKIDLGVVLESCATWLRGDELKMEITGS